jgi:hypothetical protein
MGNGCSSSNDTGTARREQGRHEDSDMRQFEALVKESQVSVEQQKRMLDRIARGNESRVACTASSASSNGTETFEASHPGHRDQVREWLGAVELPPPNAT